MDQNGQKQILYQLKRLFLPKLKKWLKKQFSSSSQGQQHQQSPATGGQQGQGAWGQQPQQQYGQNQQQYGQGQYGQGQYPQPAPVVHQPAHTKWSQADGEASQQNVSELRTAAIREGDLMKQCFDRAHSAHERGDGAEAKRLSTEGHEHQAKRDRLNKQASDLIYREKNSHRQAGEIDLHGLYVQEAIAKTEDAIQDAQRAGLPTLRVIVGKGIHSTAHVQKIRPAIEDLMQKYGLGAELDPHNAGVLIVHLDGRQGSRDAGQVTRQLAETQDGDQCIIS